MSKHELAQARFKLAWEAIHLNRNPETMAEYKAARINMVAEQLIMDRELEMESLR